MKHVYEAEKRKLRWIKPLLQFYERIYKIFLKYNNQM